MIKVTSNHYLHIDYTNAQLFPRNSLCTLFWEYSGNILYSYSYLFYSGNNILRPNLSAYKFKCERAHPPTPHSFKTVRTVLKRSGSFKLVLNIHINRQIATCTI